MTLQCAGMKAALALGIVLLLPQYTAPVPASDVTGVVRDGSQPEMRQTRAPCSCAEGQCGCCTGALFNLRQRGKNPRPVCVPLPRLQAAKFCVKFSNVYFIGRNLHMCVGLEARWQDNVLFDHSFDCLRVGADGMAVVKPEEGGGCLKLRDRAPIITVRKRYRLISCL
uniref:DUF4773 domain-containing protein n=1 Tax=Timema shepardi TaxID=629360 RepID=A0A7R9B443_TIMSH|nr:unnamed protein product [Timema shepardi]